MASVPNHSEPVDRLSNGTTQLVEVHFEDLDPTGMLHNSRYLLMLERAVTAFWLSQGWHYDPARTAFADSVQVVRSQTITYHQPIVEPGRYAVRFWVDRVGNSSYTYGYRILSPERSSLHAEGSRVQVNLDSTTLTPRPLGEALRKIATQLTDDGANQSAGAS